MPLNSPFTLTLRSEPKGGSPQIAPDKEVSRIRALPVRRLLLLIHGYNNDMKDANEAFDGFETLQEGLSGSKGLASYAPGCMPVRVYWPGDANWGVVSFLFFMQAMGNAAVSGRNLADALQRIAGGGDLRVDIVAHSLGCRVTYELIAQLRAANIRVDRVLVFAGAVATFMLEPPDPQGFVAGYDRLIAGGLLSLFSPADMVLSDAFPVGSTVTPGPQGRFPVALGHDFWASQHAPATLGQKHNNGAGHSDYWGWRPQTRDTCGQFAAVEARNFFAFSSAGIRPILGRYQPDREQEERYVASREQEQRLQLARDMYGYY